MKRASLLCVWTALALAAAGCQKSEEPNRHAEVPLDGLMPAAAPDFDPTYVADQTQIKRVHRTVSYEPLDTFRSRAPKRDRGLTATGKAGEAKATGKSTGRTSLFRRAGAALAEKLGGVTSGFRPGAGARPSTDPRLQPDDAAGAEEEPEDDLLDDEEDLDDVEEEDEDEEDLDDEDEDIDEEEDLDDEDEDDAEDEEDDD